MDMQQLAKRICEILAFEPHEYDYPQRPTVVGHNSHALARTFAHLLIDCLLEHFDQIYDINLVTPSICQHAMHEFTADVGYWLYITATETKVSSFIEVYTSEGRRSRHLLLENVEMNELEQVFNSTNLLHCRTGRATSIIMSKYSHEPNFISTYLQTLTSNLVPKYRIQRGRFRVVAGFQDSCHSRFIVHYLDSLGCKVIPVPQESVPGAELAHTVLSHQAVCGFIFDEYLNIQTFCTEQGVLLHSNPDVGVNDVLLQCFLDRLQHQHIETLLHHSYTVDGVWIVTRLLEWMTETNVCPSALLAKSDVENHVLQENGGDLRTCQGT